MARKFKAPLRAIGPDCVYSDIDVSKFINYLMFDGKKAVAEKVFYSSMEAIKEKGMDPITVFKSAISNVTPIVEARSRRVGGATYQVPIPVDEKRGRILAFRWLIRSFRAKTGTCSVVRLSEGLIEACESRGAAVSKKEEVTKVAESNRAFSHYRW